MIGVNQTTMAALAMVIIAAVIGSGEDIGFEVLKTLRRAQFGQSLLAGITIVFMAMMMDRISRKFADKRGLPHTRQGSLWERRKALWLTLIAMGRPHRDQPVPAHDACLPEKLDLLPVRADQPSR